MTHRNAPSDGNVRLLSGASPPVTALSAWAVFALATLLHLRAAMHWPADDDEFQHLSNALWLLRGERLYADFWDNHSPFITYALAQVFRFVEPAPECIRLFRAAFLTAPLATAALSGGIARRLAPQGWPRAVAPGLCGAIFLLCWPVLDKSSEIRPDWIAAPMFAAGLWVIVEAIVSQRPRLQYGAGWVLGLCFGVTVKSFFLVAICGVSLIAAFGLRRALLDHGLRLATGTALGILGVAGAIMALGDWDGFVQQCLVENFSRQPVSRWLALRESFAAMPGWWGLVAPGMVAATIMALRRDAQPAYRALVSVALLLWFQFHFLLPTHYHQSFLTFHVAACPLLALVALRGTAALPRPGLLASNPHIRAALPCIVAVAIAARVATLGPTKPTSLSAQIKWARRVEAIADTDATMFDGVGWPLRPTRHYFIRSMNDHHIADHRSGERDLRILRFLRESRPELVVLDTRTAYLGTREMDYVHAHYRQAIKAKPPLPAVWQRADTSAPDR